MTRKARRGEAMDPPHSLRKLSSLVTPLGNRHSVTLSEQGGWRRQDDLQRSLPTSQPQLTQLWVRGRGEDTNLSAELLYGIVWLLMVLLLRAERRAGAQGLQPQPLWTRSPSIPTIGCSSSLLLAISAELCSASLPAP